MHPELSCSIEFNSGEYGGNLMMLTLFIKCSGDIIGMPASTIHYHDRMPARLRQVGAFA
ncbi:hypothetical protein [Zobellella maritima]|uniref:hypothetical protein n=1 Tax=Zobellella maritima TaxID=2059725 RepID=UPI00130039E1|nr:hypothetical protein [Zobellella maritima]